MMRALASRSWLLAMLGIAGCGGRATPATTAEPSCRDVAVRGEALITAAPEAERDDATRFVAELIDLCQAPGLAVRARTCLASAATLAEARACPALPTTGDDLGDPNRGEAPSCEDVVAHAMELVDAELDDDERPDVEEGFTERCVELTADGRRCAAAAADDQALGDCLDNHLLEDEEESDDVDGDLLEQPFAP